MTASQRPWVRLYRPRPGSRFEASVSGPAKCVFARLLSLVDDDGVAALAPGDVHEAIARLLEWPAGPSRRSLRKLVDELLDHGCLVTGSADIRLPRFTDYQPSKVDQRSAKGPRKVAQSKESTVRNHSTEIDRGEERRGETETTSTDMEETTVVRRRSPSPMDRREELVERALGLVLRGYQRRYEDTTNGAWQSHAAARPHAHTVAVWALAEADRECDSPTDPRYPKAVAGAIAAALDGFFAAKGAAPIKWLAEDPGYFAREHAA